MVRIERRYQHRTREGLEWTSWFTRKEFDTMDEAKEKIKEFRSEKEGDKKLKGEYRIVED